MYIRKIEVVSAKMTIGKKEKKFQLFRQGFLLGIISPNKCEFVTLRAHQGERPHTEGLETNLMQSDSTGGTGNEHSNISHSLEREE